MAKIKQILTEMQNVQMPDGRTAVVHLAARIWKGALAGDKTFVKILLDRLEGRPPVAEPELPVPETDTLIADALLQIYGEVTKEEEQGVAGEVFEMAKISASVAEMEGRVPFK